MSQTERGRVLVTGAGGFIGSVLVGELLEAGHAVTAVDRFFFGDDTLAAYADHDGLTKVRADVRNLEPDLFADVEAVFDLAALSNDPCGDLDPGLTEAINHRGRARVCEQAKAAGVPRYVLASSCSVYGSAGDEECTETSPTQPLTTYASSNLAAEQSALALGDDGFTTTVLRNGTVFGLSPRMRFDLVVNLMTLHAFEQGRITVMGGGRQWRPLVHVRDVCGAFLAVLNAKADKVGGEVFNVGLGNFRVRTLAALVREALPIQVELHIAPDDVDRRNYRAAFSKLEQATGFAPVITVEEGIEEIYTALKLGTVENEPRCSTVGWYRTLLEAKSLVDRILLDGRML